MSKATKLEMRAGALLDALPPLRVLATTKLPIGISVSLSRMGNVVDEYHTVLIGHLRPLISEHNDGKAKIGPGDKGHAEFMKAAAIWLDEKIVLDIETIPAAALEKAGVMIEPAELGVLLRLGFITTP